MRTVEVEVQIRTEATGGYALNLRVIRASGPGAPGPGSAIGRAAEAVAAHSCFRAAWDDGARRERILRPPE